MMNTKAFITWIRIKMLWTIACSIGAVGILIVTTILSSALDFTFYLLGILFIIWYLINYLIDMFQPVPVMPKRK